MKNVYYNGSIGAYVVAINGTEYNLKALNMADAISEAVTVYNRIGNAMRGL